MNWLKKFMQGRYGGDQLSLALLVLSIILSLIGGLSKITFIAGLSYIPFVISIFRMFSKDISKRSMENYKFSMAFSPIYKKYLGLKNRIKDRKTHKYIKCPNCKQKLRVPKGKGKILVTCSKCNHKFYKKS